MTRMPLSAACFLFLAGVGTVIAAEPAAAPPAVPGAPGPDTPTVPPSAIVVTGTNTLGDAARINGVVAASPEGDDMVIVVEGDRKDAVKMPFTQHDHVGGISVAPAAKT